MVTYLLSVGDGMTADHIDLTDKARHRFRWDSPRIGSIDPATRRRQIVGQLLIPRSPAGAYGNNWARIERKLTQARQLARPHAGGQGVTFGYMVDDTELFFDDTLFFDVVDGTLTEAEWLSQDLVVALLELECLPYARGAQVVLDQSEVLTNPATIWLPNIPGDTDALARLTVTDESTGDAVINRVRVSRRSDWDLLESDFEPVVKLDAAGSGIDEDDASDYHGDTFARLVTANTWQTFAQATNPTSQTHGTIAVGVRARDASPGLNAPTGVSVEQADVVALQQTALGQGAAVNQIEMHWSQPTRPGTLLVMTVGTTGTDLGGTLTPPTGWVQAFALSATNRKTQLWYYEGHPGGRTTELLQFSANVSNLAVRMHEWSGAVAASALDVIATNSTSNTTTHPTGTTATTDQAAALAITHHVTTGNPGIELVNYTAGYIMLSPTAGVQFWANASAYRTLDAIGTQSATLTTDANVQAASGIAVFKTISSDIASLPPGNYIYVIVPYDDQERRGTPSDPIFIRLPEVGATALSWDDNDADGYYVYWKRDAQPWLRLDAGDMTTFNHTTESDAVTEEPLTDLTPALLRMHIASGTTGQVVATVPREGGVPMRLARGRWEDIVLAHVTLPPALAIEIGDPSDWIIQLQARQAALPGQTIDADVLYLMPSDEAQFEMRHISSTGTELVLDEPHDWRADTRRDLHMTAALLDDNAVVADVAQRGRLLLGPGNNQLLINVAVQDGVSDVEDARFRVRIAYTPRYRYLRGTVS